MAKMIPPSFPDDKRKDLGAESAVYYALKKQMDNDFTVLWSISTLGANVRQLDFLVLHPQFGLVVIEPKGGGLAPSHGNVGLDRLILGAKSLRVAVDQARRQ